MIIIKIYSLLILINQKLSKLRLTSSSLVCLGYWLAVKKCICAARTSLKIWRLPVLAYWTIRFGISWVLTLRELSWSAFLRWLMRWTGLLDVFWKLISLSISRRVRFLLLVMVALLDLLRIRASANLSFVKGFSLIKL